jgi:SAM-dependent methyltransferase
MSEKASQLLKDHRHLLRGHIIDLACGMGRNGLYCIEQGCEITFAERNELALNDIATKVTAPQAHFWNVDLEASGTMPLQDKQFDGAIVFRYLHRPLIPALLESIKPGGIFIYETFIAKQATIGRPKNPDFLLQPNELKSYVSTWNIQHSFEGFDDTTGAYIAQIIAIKPHV